MAAPIYRSKQAFSAARPAKSPRKTSPAPSEIRVAVKIMEMVAISTPMVASLAVILDYVESMGEDYYRYFDRDPVLRYSDYAALRAIAGYPPLV